MQELESVIEFGSSLQILKMIKKACLGCLLFFFLQEFISLERPKINVRGRIVQLMHWKSLFSQWREMNTSRACIVSP